MCSIYTSVGYCHYRLCEGRIVILIYIIDNKDAEIIIIFIHNERQLRAIPSCICSTDHHPSYYIKS